MLQDDYLNDLLLQYPGILVTENSGKIFLKGTVKIKNTWLYFEMICPNFPHIKEMTLRVQQQHEMMNFSEPTASAKSDWLISDLLENLPNIVNLNKNIESETTEQQQQAPPLKKARLEMEKYLTSTQLMQQSNICAEIASLHRQVPADYRIYSNEACTRVRFSIFAQFEQHFLELELPTLHVLEHSLPHCVPWQELFIKCPSLTALVQQFQQYLLELQDFYDNFTDIDELCYVLQPKLPTTKENWRLFLFSERVFLKLVIADPFSPLASMSLHIIGSTPEMTRLRRIYSEGLNDWDAELDIHKNLLRIFNLCFFPMPDGTTSDRPNDCIMSKQICNICYCYQLEDEGEIPIISCDNQKCNLIFHATCLKEWFNALSDGKEFLTVCFGTCPFCKAKLSTSFAELLEH